jgi:predicted O-methyltransferase YrrM
MTLEMDFIRVAQAHYDPYSLRSGTEHVGPLLYSLARMTRPRTVVEYGSGYSTLFLLRGLAENIGDFAEERRLLLEKTKDTNFLDAVAERDTNLPFGRWDEELRRALFGWMGAGARACAVDPAFYLAPYQPHLYSFEQQPADHPYAQPLPAAVEALGYTHLLTYLCGQDFSAEALPRAALPIDWAWNDFERYREFFKEFWEHLNPAGGLMIFHNAPGSGLLYDELQWIRESRRAAGDLEFLLLEEPHKLNQKGCVILRRTSQYRPRFFFDRVRTMVRDLRTLATAR